MSVVIGVLAIIGAAFVFVGVMTVLVFLLEYL